MRSSCLARGLEGEALRDFSALASVKRRLRRGAALFRNGAEFASVYVVHSGALKTTHVGRDGSAKTTGFFLPGDIVGLDAIHAGRHNGDAVALEDSEVCALSFAALAQLTTSVPALQQRLFGALAGEISRDDGLVLLMGGMSAEQRLAAFLLSLSHRYERLGFSARCFVLRMTRDDIGSYLGLTLETVCRIFSRFQRCGLIRVDKRDLELHDPDRLAAIADI